MLVLGLHTNATITDIPEYIDYSFGPANSSILLRQLLWLPCNITKGLFTLRRKRGVFALVLAILSLMKFFSGS